MRRAVAILCAAPLILAGCGGEGGGEAAEGGPIKIGQIASLTGNYSPLGTNDRRGAELAVEEINEAGGIDGRNVELIVRDDETQPDQSVIAFNDLVGQDVAGVVGSSFSNSSLATIPIAERQQIPYISAAASDEQVEPLRSYAFMTPPTAGVVATRLLEYFQAEGMTRMAVAYDGENAFASIGWEKMSAEAADHGITFVAEEEFETGTKDFSSTFTHIRDSGAQGLMVWATGSPAVILTKQFAGADLDMKLVMSHAEASTLYTEPAGEAAEGVVVASSLAVIGPHLPESKLRDTVLAMAEPFEQAHGYYPPQFAFDGYCAVKLLAAAIEQAGSTEPAAVQAALENLSLLTPLGEYQYTPQDHAGLGPDDVAIDVVTDGELVPTDWSKEQLAQTLTG